MNTIDSIQQQLRQLADPVIAEHSLRFFKTGDGEYGQGDKFHGIRVPAIRQIVKSTPVLSLPDIEALLYDEFHETRLLSALALVKKYEKSRLEEERKQIVGFYLQHAKQFNNWDLVDSSSHKILGPALLTEDKSLLFELAAADNLWQRRIAVITTYYFIKRGEFEITLQLAEQLLADQEDLIHKAVGWMLREVSNKDFAVGSKFVKNHCKSMPRTMLRYAIEKYPKDLRGQILRGEI